MDVDLPRPHTNTPAQRTASTKRGLQCADVAKTNSGLCYIPVCDGGSNYQLLMRKSNLSETDAAAIVRQECLRDQMSMQEIFSPNPEETQYGVCAFCKQALLLPPFDPSALLRCYFMVSSARIPEVDWARIEMAALTVRKQVAPGASTTTSCDDLSGYDDCYTPQDQDDVEEVINSPAMFSRITPDVARYGVPVYHDQMCWFLQKLARMGPENKIIKDLMTNLPHLRAENASEPLKRRFLEEFQRNKSNHFTPERTRVMFMQKPVDFGGGAQAGGQINDVAMN